MPDDLRSLATAHRVLAGASVLAVLLIILGSFASLIEIINAPAGAVLWAAAGILVVIPLCWLLAVIHVGPPRQGNNQTSVRPNRVLGYLSAAMLIAGAALAGWNVRAAAVSPSRPPVPSASTPTPAVTVKAAPGTARIDVPLTGTDLVSCVFDVRFHGTPAPGKKFVVATKQARSGYYFEADLSDESGDGWSANVQAGAKKLTSDERYVVSIFEHDKVAVDYLTAVVSEVEGDSTYWPSPQLPPGMTAALDSIVVKRVKADSRCPA